MEVEVLHEDGDLAIICKKAGIAVHPGPHEHHLVRPVRLANKANKATLLTEPSGLVREDGASGVAVGVAVGVADGVQQQKRFLIEDLQNHWPNLPGPAERPGIVHRLDKDTEGLMIIAKTETAYHNLIESFAKRRIRKRYVAWTYGFLASDRHFGRVQTGISRNPRARLKMMVTEGGKPAETIYRVLQVMKTKTGLRYYKLLLAPRTGRTHQLRVHLAHLGIPVVNDPWYAPKHAKKKSRNGLPYQKKINSLGLLLQAQGLRFFHPIEKKKRLHFSLSLSNRLQQFEEIVCEF